MTDRMEALKLAGELVLAYPSRNITDKHANMWADEFQPMSSYAARQVVKHLADRSSDPPSRAQIKQAYREVRQETMSSAFDWKLCVFLDGVTCSNCGEVHGHLLDPSQITHGRYHLRLYLDGDESHREASRKPEGCSCTDWHGEPEEGLPLAGVISAMQGHEKQEDAEKAEWKRAKAATLAAVRMHGVCGGAGKTAVLLDDRLVCPDCQAPIEGW